MKFRITKEKLISWAETLNKSYSPRREKSMVKIAELVLILPALGMFYIWEYFNHFKIDYYVYFELKDALSVLYQNLMPVIYIGVIFSLFLTVLLPDILRRLLKNDNNSVFPENSEEEKSLGLSNFAMLLTIVLMLAGFFVLLNAHGLTLGIIAVLLVFAALTSYFYLFVNKNLGFATAVLLAFLYAEVRANIDAKYVIENKPRIDILLKSHSEKPILTEKDPCSFLIYKTSNYYFIKNNCTKMINAYSVSSGEMTGFHVK
ncbi:hypothetical protein J2787_001064 [Chryseobacterium rhizosphaerae]|uniref:Uncharacterized protein n=1 Tax=Chryseobacterium rhizosphaerae TaxID=395937 RepID=A0AAE4C2N2_9FLAO|nr:hypothetical protein [Chryseobacterium rhizosphaerae]MDR6525694.1 hypothetical protein [Chryseobacterium rhizosphaerae]